jgi:hypothetical protein
MHPDGATPFLAVRQSRKTQQAQILQSDCDSGSSSLVSLLSPILTAKALDLYSQVVSMLSNTTARRLPRRMAISTVSSSKEYE